MDHSFIRKYQQVYEWARDSERPGGEFDWYSTDEVGNIGAFCTAGYGEIPNAVFDVPWAPFLELVLYLESLGSPLHSGGFEPYTSRRLFTFDYAPWESGVYSKIVAPKKPLLLEELPVGLRRTIEAVQFPGKFEETICICAPDVWSCR